MRPVLLCALLVALAGCGAVGKLGSVLGGGTAAAPFDAHVVYQMRDGCPTLVARTLRYGYTVMTPTKQPLAVPFELTGVFEGPLREGESVFRYTPPDRAPTWPDDAAEVPVNVLAVRLSLPDARAHLAVACALPDGEGGPADDDVPRLPAGS